MQAKGRMIVRALLSRFHNASSLPSILKCLPPEEAKQILAEEALSIDFADVLAQPVELIKKIHYSWLIPEIKKLPPSIQASLIAALPDPFFTRLRSLPEFSQMKVSEIKVPPPVQSFLIHLLYSRVRPFSVLPFSFLPQTALTPLLHYDKKQIVELIDFLGIHDLAEGMRYIIDKKGVKKLYMCLTPKKRQFFRICLHQQEKVVATRLNLKHWNGQCDQLESLLHHRGLLRLGKALCGQHPDFLWHLAHVLDTGRGALILKHYVSTAIPGVTPALAQQVMNLMNFLQTKSEA